MKKCIKCQIQMPIRQEIDGKIINTQRRKFCFNCSPYKSHNTRDLTKPPRDIKEWRRGQSKKKRIRLKNRIIKAMGDSCQCCGYNLCRHALELHHLNQDEKEFNFSRLNTHYIKWSKIVQELRKCVLVCCRCHREIHANFRNIPENAKRFNEDWIDYKSMELKMVDPVGFEPTASSMPLTHSTD